MAKRIRTNNYLQNIHIKLKIELNEPREKSDVNSGAPEEWAVLAPLVAPVYVELKYT
jgi:hypothetical protein